MIVPPPWRALAIAAAAAVHRHDQRDLRLAAGGHFFTDVLFGALSTILILMALQKLIGHPMAATVCREMAAEAPIKARAPRPDA